MTSFLYGDFAKNRIMYHLVPPAWLDPYRLQKTRELIRSGCQKTFDLYIERVGGKACPVQEISY